MTFSAEYRVFIKVLRQKNEHSDRLWDLGEAAGACVSSPDSFVTSISWSRAWSKSGNISTRCSSMKRWDSGFHVFELVFEHMEDILITHHVIIHCLLARMALKRSCSCKTRILHYLLSTIDIVVAYTCIQPTATFHTGVYERLVNYVQLSSHTLWVKKQYKWLLMITLVNVDRFTESFHCQIPDEIL